MSNDTTHILLPKPVFVFWVVMTILPYLWIFLQNGYLFLKKYGHLFQNAFSLNQKRYSGKPAVRNRKIFNDEIPDDKKILQHDLVKISEAAIGKGNFGEVYSGILIKSDGSEKPVAIKVASKIEIDSPEVKDLIDECCHALGISSHPNVLIPDGMFFPEMKDIMANDFFHDTSGMFKRPLIISDFMAEGDALKYINKDDLKIKLIDVINLSIDLASGIAHLHNHQLVHRDIAARNCLLKINSKGAITLKISDFGLSKKGVRENYKTILKINKETVREEQLPIGWLAPEVLTEQEFSVDSDLWALGVTIWEFFTKGKVPYRSLTGSIRNGNRSSKWEKIVEGYRLQRPHHMPDYIYQLLLLCWHKDPERRPEANVVQNALCGFVRQPSYYECSENALQKLLPMKNGITMEPYVKCNFTELDSKDIIDEQHAVKVPFANRRVSLRKRRNHKRNRDTVLIEIGDMDIFAKAPSMRKADTIRKIISRGRGNKQENIPLLETSYMVSPVAKPRTKHEEDIIMV